MMRPFISSDGQRHDGDRVLGGVVGRDALDRGDDDVARLVLGLVARLALDGPGEAHGVVLGLVADGLEELRLGLVAAHAADPLEGGDLLLLGPRELLAMVVQLALAIEQLAVALLEHVGALVELLVALEEPVLEAADLGPLGARLVFGLALQADLLVLGLEDEVLLLGPGLGDDATGLLLGVLDGLAAPEATHDETEDRPAPRAMTMPSARYTDSMAPSVQQPLEVCRCQATPHLGVGDVPGPARRRMLALPGALAGRPGRCPAEDV